jgi:deazaflavin-dependent oxidoreductase (nitroreductase family)
MLRHVPLLYVQHGSGYLVIGSKGGSATDPVWYSNLEAQPDCEIRVAALRTKARARSLGGAERAQAWKLVTAKHPVYARYQARTEREIPVVLLEPLAG